MGIQRMARAADDTPLWHLVMATTILALLPPVLVVIAMQRLFVKGLVETRSDGGKVAEVALRHVSKTYAGGIVAVRDVSLTFPTGTCAFWSARRAAASRPCLRMVAGLEAITAGRGAARRQGCQSSRAGRARHPPWYSRITRCIRI